MPRSNLVNAVDVALADPVTGVDSTIRVTSPELLPVIPFYLVIDPFGDSSREYLFATALAVDVLTVTRDLEGSQSTNHDAGDIVRITYAAQHLSDVWDAIEGIPAPVPQTYLHADLTDVATDQHHAKYTDAEAIAAVGPHTPAQTYLHADLTDIGPSDHHVKTPDQTFLHLDLTDVASDQHHARYTDAEAIAAVGTPWTGYLPLTGGTLTGHLAFAGLVGISLAGGDIVGGNNIHSSRVRVDSGAVGAPAFTFDSDQTTGIYQPGTNRMTLVTGGVAQWEINAAGNLVNPTNNNGIFAGDGTVGVPAYSFNVEQTTGFYRIGVGEWGLSSAGVLVLSGSGGAFPLLRSVVTRALTVADPPNMVVDASGVFKFSTVVMATQQDLDDTVASIEARLISLESV